MGLLQIPRYIITLHELLAHTPHDHVERESLEYAKSKLEELSKVRVVRLLFFYCFYHFVLGAELNIGALKGRGMSSE